MRKRIQMVLRICSLAVVVLFCYLAILSVKNIMNWLIYNDMVKNAVPIDSNIENMARQLEEGRGLIELNCKVANDETPEDVVFAMFDMVENYSDEAAKISLHNKSVVLNMKGQVIESFQMNYAVLEADQDSLEREYDRMYEEICRGIKNPEEASDRRKLDAILAYMAREFTYDRNYDKSQLQLLPRVTESKKIVCTGYSEIIDELCERMNIDCRIITNKEHAWNYVRLDGANDYIQIDGTNKYMPYLISINEFSYQPVDDVKLASVLDNCIFWVHSYPFITFVMVGILIYSIIEAIRKRNYIKKHMRKSDQISKWRVQKNMWKGEFAERLTIRKTLV